MNTTQKQVASLYGKIAQKCMELSMISDFQFHISGTEIIRVNMIRHINNECYLYQTKRIYRETADDLIYQLDQLYQTLSESVEEGAPKREWVVEMAADYLDRHEESSWREVCRIFDLERSDIDHLFAKEEEEEVAGWPNHHPILQVEGLLKSAGMSFKDFI
ncbi:hypothetical protein [Sediminibacillus massiliensis]|uniref:hypothetical protein n=1 Tax=Sediminibacillus massiliensis TaxID=1926277 RepID=UPI00098888E2|nr:hypothetical protein [Sediminibacillus massiliensis]